jgi:hypothetical protein
MPDVSPAARARVSTWVAIDQHKLSLVPASLPASGGTPEVVRVENPERAIRRFVEKLGGPGSRRWPGRYPTIDRGAHRERRPVAARG